MRRKLLGLIIFVGFACLIMAGCSGVNGSNSNNSTVQSEKGSTTVEKGTLKELTPKIKDQLKSQKKQDDDEGVIQTVG